MVKTWTPSTSSAWDGGTRKAGSVVMASRLHLRYDAPSIRPIRSSASRLPKRRLQGGQPTMTTSCDVARRGVLGVPAVLIGAAVLAVTAATPARAGIPGDVPDKV